MPRLSVWMIRMALLHLGTGMLLGSLMLFNKGIVFYPALGQLLLPHIELLLMGWLLQLAMGTAVWVVPRFSGTHRYGRLWLGWLAFILFNLGIALSVMGYSTGEPALAGRVIELAAGIVYVLFIWSRIKPMGEGIPPEHTPPAAKSG